MKLIYPAYLKCDECKIVESPYIEFEHEGKRIWVCKYCLKKALTMIEEAENETG